MNMKDDALTAGVDQLNGLLGWWAAPIAGGNGMMNGQMKRLQQFASDMQKMCGDAYSQQIGALFSSNEQLVRSLQDLLRSQRPQEVLAAELEISATFLENASQQTTRWADLTQKLQECCAAMARDAAEDLRQEVRETPSTIPSAEPERHAVKPARKRAAHA